MNESNASWNLVIKSVLYPAVQEKIHKAGYIAKGMRRWFNVAHSLEKSTWEISEQPLEGMLASCCPHDQQKRVL